VKPVEASAGCPCGPRPDERLRRECAAVQGVRPLRGGGVVGRSPKFIAAGGMWAARRAAALARRVEEPGTTRRRAHDKQA
jgi:hypothetical protein